MGSESLALSLEWIPGSSPGTTGDGETNVVNTWCKHKNNELRWVVCILIVLWAQFF